MKLCSKCDTEKDESEFYFRNKKTYKLQSYCKDCYKIYHKEYSINNIEKKKVYIRKYYEKNKEMINDRNKNYYQRNKEDILKRQRNYRENNIEKIREMDRKRGKTDKRKIYVRERIRKERREIVSKRLKHNVSRMIVLQLKKQNSSKNNCTIFEYLPYSIQELKQHLESQFESWMNWENYGRYEEGKLKWQIDHIMPQSLLPYDSMEHPNFQKCWALENLRPLNAMENNIKKNKLL